MGTVFPFALRRWHRRGKDVVIFDIHVGDSQLGKLFVSLEYLLPIRGTYIISDLSTCKP